MGFSSCLLYTSHTLRAALNRRVFVLVSDEAEGSRLCEDLAALGDEALFLPARDLALRRVESTSRDYEQMRLGILALSLIHL